ncbi:MAG: sigma-70 family RNA polymerase sigma factor [Bacteroidia bacterium]|nr:sigma-70 family RNA polymerase sigma factor [Bacteroidia bacterium]
MMQSPIETQITQLLAQQDKEAIRLIFQFYKRALFGVIVGVVRDEELAEDVFQEALVKIWRNGPRYDATKGRLYTWMLNICRNAAIDKTRSKHFQASLVTQTQDIFVSGSESPSQQVETQTDTLDLKQWVNKLSPEHQEVVNMIYFGGRTHQEASEELDLPLGTVKSRLRKALGILRTWMSQ